MDESTVPISHSSHNEPHNPTASWGIADLFGIPVAQGCSTKTHGCKTLIL